MCTGKVKKQWTFYTFIDYYTNKDAETICMEPCKAIHKKTFVSEEANNCEEKFNLAQDRIGNIDWCICRCECKLMATLAESFCLLLGINHRSVRGASRPSAFMATARLSATRVGLSPRWKWNEDTGSVQDFIFWFCIWCKWTELGGKGSLRFPCVTNLSGEMISYWAESHLESCQTSTMALFCENSQRSK